MRHALLLIFATCALALSSCDSNGNKPDDGGNGSARSKLERPNVLPRPPSGGLPADLRPPR
jgi:hypothetical protein